MNNEFTSHGYKYRITTHGVIEQIDPQPYVYDAAYSATYDTPEYTRQSELLQAMRLGFIKGVYGRFPVKSLLDVGYGNGAFMRMAKQHIPYVFGADVTEVEVPEGCFKAAYFPPLDYTDVITFHDCLEHIHDLSFLKTIKAGLIVVSLPWCHLHTEGTDWFSNQYKHRKPNEHVRHFDDRSLMRMMDSYDWTALSISNHEDIVRKSAHGLPNILTMAFKKF